MASIATVTNWGFAFLVTKFFDQIQQAITAKWCYWMFAIICAANFVFVFLLLPETKGKSVEEIERHFGVPSSNANQTGNNNTTRQNKA